MTMRHKENRKERRAAEREVRRLYELTCKEANTVPAPKKVKTPPPAPTITFLSRGEQITIPCYILTTSPAFLADFRRMSRPYE